MLRGIIFDLDGTLISLHADGTAFRRGITDELARGGFRMDMIDATSRGLYVQDILDQARAQIEKGFVKADYETVRANAFKALDALELGWIRHTRPLPGARDMLSRLAREEDGKVSITLALLTNSGRAATKYALEHHDFGRYFHKSFTRDDLPAMKPRPDGIIAVLDALGLQRGEVLYVGDSPVDIIATRAAGVRIASVATGKHGFDALRDLGPHYVLRSLSDLEELIKTWDEPEGRAKREAKREGAKATSSYPDAHTPSSPASEID
jgi:phosphoglycolate phosphatase